MLDTLQTMDQNLFYSFNSLIGHSTIFDFILKIIAIYAVYLVPILLIFFWFWHKKEETQKFLLNLLIMLGISWQVITPIIGSLVNRARPFDLAGAHELVFHVPSYSFPSDHALFFAALTTYLFLGKYNKAGTVAFIATILVSFARVIGGLHWPGDILFGWILGALLAYLFWLIRKPIEKYITAPILGILKKIKLA